jgi:tetratricopeptide (TPR) repeat protein
MKMLGSMAIARFSLASLICIFLLNGFLRTASAKPSAGEFLRRGNVELSRNNFGKAIRHYTRAIELDPSLAEAYLRRGMAFRATGKLSLAIQDFERAGRIDPQAISNNRYVADAYSNRGYIELNDLELGNAIEDFTKAIESYEDALHYYRRGQARLIAEDLDAAIEDFTRALTFSRPNDFLRSMIYANRGYALQLQGKKEDAQSDFRNGFEPNSGQRILIQLHLRSLEDQIKEMRRRRAQAQRKIA